MIVVLIYFFMLLFDSAIIAGTVWLIGWQGWNPWWMALAMLLVGGSWPGPIIRHLTIKSNNEKIV